MTTTTNDDDDDNASAMSEENDAGGGSHPQEVEATGRRRGRRAGAQISLKIIDRERHLAARGWAKRRMHRRQREQGALRGA